MRITLSRRSPDGRRCGTIFVAAVLLASCRHQSPEQDLLDKAAPAASWISTLQMTGEKWTANSVPTSFVTTTCQAADEDLGQTADAAAESKARPEVRDPLRLLISQIRTSEARLRHAATADDRQEAASQSQRLAALRREFEAWKKSVGPP